MYTTRVYKKEWKKFSEWQRIDQPKGVTNIWSGTSNASSKSDRNRGPDRENCPNRGPSQVMMSFSGLLDFKDRLFDSVYSMWDSFKEQIHKSMDRRVPSKMTLAPHTHPWMNGRIRRLIRQKQRAHKKARTTGIKRDMDRNRQLQHDVQFQIRSAHKDFMKTAVSDTFKDNPKKFWSFVKNTGQEATGVSPGP